MTNPLATILVVIDIANSTQFIEKVGDRRASQVFKVYDRIFRGLLYRHNGLEIDKTDGALLLFSTISDALNYANQYHSLIEKHTNLKSRVGIHSGIVYTHSNSRIFVSRGAKPIEVEGLQKAVTARIMSLADGGQTIISQRCLELIKRKTHLLLHPHYTRHIGDYKLKGVSRPMSLYLCTPKKDRLHIPKNKSKVKQVKKPSKSTSEKVLKYGLPPFILLSMHELSALWISLSVFGYAPEYYIVQKIYDSLHFFALLIESWVYY